MKQNDKITRIAYVIEAGFEYFISLFVTSTMLGYILDSLGFSDALQGIISTVATFTCGAQLFAIALVGRKRKRLVTIGHLINQLCFVFLYLLPIFNISSSVKTIVFTVLLFGGHIINNAINPAKITWLMGSVQNEKRGRFTAIKEMVSLSGGIAVSLVFGAVADVFRDGMGMPTRPYYLICAAALAVMTAVHTATLLVSGEKQETCEEKTSVKSAVLRMARNKEFVRIVGVGVLWNVASALSVSFYASYVRQELAFSFTVIAAITTVGSIVRIIVSPFLGRLADKYSFSTSMTVSFAVVAVAFLAMAFAAPQTRWLYLVYVCLHAFAMAGINSGVINLIYDYVPSDDRAVAMGVKNALGGILGFFVALFSGFLLSKIQAVGGFCFFGMTVYAQQVLSVLSFVATVALVIYMRTVIAPLHKLQK